jgi:hypothetical protein
VTGGNTPVGTRWTANQFRTNIDELVRRIMVSIGYHSRSMWQLDFSVSMRRLAETLLKVALGGRRAAIDGPINGRSIPRAEARENEI